MEAKANSEVYEPFLLLRHSTTSKRPKNQEDRKVGLIRRISSMKPGSVQSSFCALFSSTVGIGFLSIPYATAECGLILGTMVLVLGGLCFGIYYKALAQTSDRTGIYSYVGMVENLYGPNWGFFSELVIIISCFGLLSVMWVVTQEIVTSLFPVLESTWQKAILLLIIGLVLELPLSIKPEIASIRYASAFSFVCILFLAAVICLDVIDLETDLTDIPLFNFNLKTIDSVILVLFAYDATLFIPIIFSEMTYSRRRSYTQMREVIKRTNLILIVFYLILGLGGFTTLYPEVPEILVFRKAIDTDMTMHVGKYLVLITILTEMPLVVNPARLTVQQMIGGTAFRHQPSIYYPTTLALVFLPIVMSLIFRKELAYFKILGGICSVIHGFILPSTHQTEPWYTAKSTEVRGRGGGSSG